MKNFFGNLAYRMQRMMYGRYGIDEFSKFLDKSAIVLFILSLFKPLRFLYFLSMAFLLCSLLRCYSKNHTKRYAELNYYLKIKNKIEPEILTVKNRFSGRKNYRYFKCPNCKTLLKVPKGKGKIEITCPKCKNIIIRKT